MTGHAPPPLGLVTIARKHLEARCRASGVAVSDIESCIRSASGDLVTVDFSCAGLTGPRRGHCGGPGSELKRLLSLARLPAKQECGCASFAAKMDHWGSDGCEQRIDEILAHLRIQAAKASIPFSAFVAEKLVRLAIRRARKSAQKPSPGGHKPNSP